jgi:hypothetical protein
MLMPRQCLHFIRVRSIQQMSILGHCPLEQASSPHCSLIVQCLLLISSFDGVIYILTHIIQLLSTVSFLAYPIFLLYLSPLLDNSGGEEIYRKYLKWGLHIGCQIRS